MEIWTRPAKNSDRLFLSHFSKSQTQEARTNVLASLYLDQV